MYRQILLLISLLSIALSATTLPGRAQEDFSILDKVGEQSAAEGRHLIVIAQLKIALGDATLEQARSDFAEDFKKIGSLPQGDVEQRLTDLANRYADRIEEAIEGAEWPGDRDEDEYRSLAIVKLAILREEALRAIAAGASPLAALEAMNLILAWTGGNSEIADAGDFAATDAMVESTGDVYAAIEKPKRDTAGDTAGNDGAPYEAGVERKGGNYTGIELEAPDPAICEFVCQSEERCVAWSYVNPGRDAGGAACWLKSSVPPPVPDECCVSGVKP